MKIKILFIVLLVSVCSWGQVNISGGTTITQNFDGLGTSAIGAYTNNTTLAGWYITTAGLPINTGTTNANSCYNFGIAATNPLSDRALGAISTATTHRFGLRLYNNGVSAISSFDISFTGEQWRAFNAGTLVFEYQTGTTVTSLTAGTWTAFSTLDFTSISTSGGTALDGNAPANRTAKSGTLTVSVPAGTEIFFRWTRAGTSSPALAIDDLSITAYASCTPPSDPVGSISASSSTCGTTTLAYTGADAAFCYWQTSATGTATSNPASSNYVASSSATYYVRRYDGTSCWSNNSVSYAATVANNPTVSNPSNASVVETFNTSFSVTATNAGIIQWQVNDGSGFVTVNNNATYSGATTTTLSIIGATLSMNGYIYQCIVAPVSPCGSYANSSAATLTVTPNVTNASDIAAVSGSEAATISSTVNNTTISSSTDGVKVWEFYVRDGGSSLNDADTYPTILNTLTITKSTFNGVGTWSDGIYSVALFDGTTFIANGTVTATQIQFGTVTPLNFSIADNTQKKLTLRLSLKCPLGAGAIDGDDFGFTILKANVAFSTSGSGMLSSFTSVSTPNNTNIIDVTATKLTFTTQPTNTGVNAAMATVVVKATDACGNIDSAFTGAVSLTSTGTMNAVTPVTAVAGVASFTTIVHTVIGTGYSLTASASGLSNAISNLFNITAVTVFSEGDFAVVGLNANIATCVSGYSSGDDEISFITFKDIQNGDVFYITDNGYDKATTGTWGDTEGIYQITRSGSTLTAGTVITFRFLNSSPYLEFNSPDTSWIFSKATGFTGTVNMNAGGDQIFFMQGGAWNNPAGTDNATYSPGTLLYAFNTGTTWTSLANSTQQSGLPLSLRCFNMMPGGATDYLEYTGPTTPAEKFDWIIRLNNSSNWTNRGSCAGYTRMHVGMSYSITTDTTTNGVWTGSKSTDWFDCGNWQTLKVPTATTDVAVNATYATKDAVIDVVANSANAALYSSQAKCNNISVSSRKVQLEGSTSNTLDVNGNLSITSAGAIDMDDSNSGTVDGQINLYGNWTNSVGTTAFLEGNGTVHFTGTGTQVVSSPSSAEGTETFYNVILNNNFDTTVSNDLIASNNLVLNASKTLTVDSAGFVRVNNKLTNNGNVFIDSSGQLIQVNDTDTNDGTYTGTKFQIKRTALARNTDYVYWSSPLAGFDVSNVPNGYRYIWDTAYNNTNGTQGSWTPASGAMAKGKGYIARASNGSTTAVSLPLTFSNGQPNNGAFSFNVYRGNYTGADYDADATNPDNVLTTKYDDNWNLVGNPYPSAIDAESFLVLNQAVIDGSVWIWKHGLIPNSTTSPFYANFQNNYSSSDYIKYNGLGSTEPDTFAGKIATGQGFMVTMKDVGSLSATGSNVNLDVYSSSITFNNSLRSDSATNPYMPHNNTDFFKTSNSNASASGNPTATGEEKHRIWLDILNNNSHQTDRMLLGYSAGSTMGRDNLYDCFIIPRGDVSLYSLIDDESFIIQGRALPFDVSDVVPLGMNIVEAGSHTIAIKKVDGLFAGDTNIYLEDKQLHIIHDLKQAPYVFTAEKGVFNNRFVLRYTNEDLGNHGFESLDNSVVVSARHGIMKINSYIETMQEVMVYDVLGRQLLDAKNIDNNDFTSANFTMGNQAIIVKIKLENGTVVTRKIMI